MAHTLVHLSPPLTWTSTASQSWEGFCLSFQARVQRYLAEHVRLGVVVGFPSSLREGFEVLLSACRGGRLSEAQDYLGQLRRCWGPHTAPSNWLDELVQGLALTREVSPTLQDRLLDGLSEELAVALASASGFTHLERGKLRLGLPPAESAWVLAESQEDQPTTLVKLAESWNPERCEYWRSEPGLYTADPRMVPQARLLRKIDYASAKELARLQNLRPGAEVLDHLEKCGISLRVGAAVPHPSIEFEGTFIEPGVEAPEQVHAVVCQRGLTLLSVDSEEMWRKSGFLAKLFAALGTQQLSIDLLATSQTNVSLTLDPQLGLGETQHRHLEQALGVAVNVIHPCAAVTLVGRRLRALLPRLG